MKETHIGLAIRRLAESKNVTVEYIAEKLSIDRQSVYATYKRANVSPKTIEKYADVIGITVNDVMQEVGYSNTKVLQNEALYNNGDGYLMRYLEELEQSNKWLRDQIKEKDEQIKDFREMLGKPLASSTTPL